MRWWASPPPCAQRWTLVPEVAIPHSRVTSPSAPRSSASRRVPGSRGIADADRPGVAGRDADRHVAVAVHEGRAAGRDRERAVREPALRDAVEVEPDARLALDGGAAGGPAERPAASGPRTGIDRVAGAGLRGQALVEQGRVDQAVGHPLGLTRPVEGGRQRGPDRHQRRGRRVEAHELGVGREPGQATGPGLDAVEDAQGRPLETDGVRPVEDLHGDDAAHHGAADVQAHRTGDGGHGLPDCLVTVLTTTRGVGLGWITTDEFGGAVWPGWRVTVLVTWTTDGLPGRPRWSCPTASDDPRPGTGSPTAASRS